MSNSLIISLFCISITVSSYKALSKKDRNDFLNSYKAVKTAYIESNYHSILKFTPELLIRFESIMLDPRCKNLRLLYSEMDHICKDVQVSSTINSLETIIQIKQSTGDIRGALLTTDTILSLIASVDSIKYQIRYSIYDSLIREISKDKSISTYSFLVSLKYVKTNYLNEYRNGIQDKFDNKIAQLSALMNPDSINVFKTHYPGIRNDDVSALFERSRIALKHSISRQPSIQGYMHYRELFGDDKMLKDVIHQQSITLSLYPNPDPEHLKEYVKLFPDEEQSIWASFEDSLFNLWNSSKSPIKAQNYLHYYPQGRYSSVIMDYIKSFTIYNQLSPGTDQ